LILTSLVLGRLGGADCLVLADGGQGALAVGLAVVHELVVAWTGWRGGIHTILVRAVGSSLAMSCQRVQVDLLGLLSRLVRRLPWHSAGDLLELCIALLHVALVTSVASGGLSRLRNYLLCLLRLGVVVALSWLSFALHQVWVVHQVFDITVISRLVVVALVVAVVQADCNLF